MVLFFENQLIFAARKTTAPRRGADKIDNYETYFSTFKS